MTLKISLIAAISSLLVAFNQVQQVNSHSEPYVYAIYYGVDDCSDEPGVLRGYATDQPFEVHGSEDPNGRDCTVGAVCLIDPTSEACQDNTFVKEGSATFSISDDGLVFECDSTNPDAECSFLDQCYGSSTFPNCYFRVATKSDLVATPSIIKTTRPSLTSLQESSYLVYYSDDQCTSLEGIDGVVNGETNSLAITPDTVSCRDAMACAFHPEEGVNQACTTVLEGGSVEFADFVLDPVSPEGEAVVCTGNSTCAPVEPQACQQSTIHPSCHYRIVTSTTLFSNPEEFLTGYRQQDFDFAEEESDAGEEAVPDETVDTPATTGAQESGSAPQEGSGEEGETSRAEYSTRLGAFVAFTIITLAFQ